MDARAITWSRPASSCPTGAGAASTTAPTSAARSPSPASTPTPPAGPYAFTQQQGNGDLAFLEKQLGAYIKDDWQVRPGLSLAFGLRYDWQNYFHDNNNVAPRFSVAYAPGNKKTNVLRAGVGVFNDRSGPVVIADVLHSQPGGLIKYVITDPGYPDPFASAASRRRTPPSIVRLAPDVQIPQTLQYSVGLDHQLQKTLTLSLTYTGARGYHLFRSRDVNAPPPPLYLTRPDPAYGAVRAGGVDRPPGDRLAAGDAARQGDALVQRPDAVHAEPRRQRHQRHRRRSPPTTTTCRASGRAPTSIGVTASTCSAGRRRSR